MRSTVVASFVLICWSVLGLAQSPPDKQTQPGIIARSGSSNLMGRSEMQRPKPIPVVKPLRFSEIPVGLCLDSPHLETSRPPIPQPPSPPPSERTRVNATEHAGIVQMR